MRMMREDPGRVVVAQRDFKLAHAKDDDDDDDPTRAAA